MRANEFIVSQTNEGALDFMKSTAKTVGKAAASTAKWAHRRITNQQDPTEQYQDSMGIAKVLENWKKKILQLQTAGVLEADIRDPNNKTEYKNQLKAFISRGLDPSISNKLLDPQDTDIQDDKTLTAYFTKNAARVAHFREQPATSNSSTPVNSSQGAIVSPGEPIQFGKEKIGPTDPRYASLVAVINRNKQTP